MKERRTNKGETRGVERERNEGEIKEKYDLY